MATRRDLGVSYLLGTGLGLIGAVAAFFLLMEDVGVETIVGTLIAGVLSGTFVFVGYWMYQNDINDDTVWTVSRWSAVGLAVPVGVLGVLFVVGGNRGLLRALPGIVVNLIAVGGSSGSSWGWYSNSTKIRRSFGNSISAIRC